MKTQARLLAAMIVFLSFFFPVHEALSCTGTDNTANGKPCISVENFTQNEIVSPRPVHLKLHIVPAPTPLHPVHVHIYVNNRMSTMFTATSQDATVVLRHLRKGTNTITIVQADAKTHMEMDMGSMSQSSPDMSGMSGMSIAAQRNASIAHLTLIVK